MSISETRSADGLRSELVVERTDRRDSGAYRCQASNPYGRSDHFVHLAVQGIILDLAINSLDSIGFGFNFYDSIQQKFYTIFCFRAT